MSPERSAARELGGFLAGPSIWAAHFFLLYGAESFAPIGTAAQVTATLVAPGLLGVLAFGQFKALRSGPANRVFLRQGSIALAGLAALAVVWTTLPVLLAS